jgi:Mg2+/citrate symporter
MVIHCINLSAVVISAGIFKDLCTRIIDHMRSGIHETLIVSVSKVLVLKPSGVSDHILAIAALVSQKCLTLISYGLHQPLSFYRAQVSAKIV